MGSCGRRGTCAKDTCNAEQVRAGCTASRFRLYQSSHWTHLGEAVAELGGQDMGERHQLRRLVGGVAEHVTLVARARLLQRLGAHPVHALPDVRRLLLDVHQHLRARVVRLLLFWSESITQSLEAYSDGLQCAGITFGAGATNADTLLATPTFDASTASG